MKRIVVFGANGQLGQSLQLIAKKRNLDTILFLSRDVNILSLESLQKVFEKEQPAYTINCAAYTAVDKAEEEIDAARNVNRDGVAAISQVCKQFNVTLIHISTDFVFSGNSHSPLSEYDSTNPVNMYGLTKLEGEQAISLYLDKYFIIRTSCLYSEYGNNFVKTMLRFSQEKRN